MAEIKGPFNCMTPMMEKALSIALKAHHGQEDKAGCPYINHPLTVATFCAGDPVAMTVALLHDVVEDTDYIFEELEKEFPAEIIDALRLVTHAEGEPYMDYIRRIKESGNAIALKVKIADMRHNMDTSRIDNPDARAIWRLEEKYKPAWKYLHE